MDHRAIAEAQHIEQMGDPVLRFTGGKMSPEMEIPKLFWLKKNMPGAFHRAAHFFDLPDWLVHRATGSLERSLCSTGCKWTYDTQNGANGEGWSRNFFQALGLETLLENDAQKIGQTFLSPGVPVSNGLSEKAAKELGLKPGTPVGASLIDAYAGALGTLGVQKDETEQGTRLALISGTSACHIVPSDEPVYVNGMWGPYLAALTPSKWVNEAGQSFAGALIDRVIAGHSANNQLHETAKAEEKSIYDVLHEKLAELAGTSAQTHLIGKDLHIQPDFLGNRSPLADPTRKGAIVGLTPQCDLDDLARQYLATIQALAYGSRQIIEKLNEQGVGITTIVVSGGLAQNELYLREHADATGCTILVPDTKEPVLLGGAMLGAFASGAYARLEDAMTALSGNATTITPRDANIRAYHDAKYGVFLRMQNDYAAYQALMHEFGE
jgi:FGGY-family pentulose kinase